MRNPGETRRQPLTQLRSRFVLAVFLGALLPPGRVVAQAAAVPIPEFYGVYVVVGGKPAELRDAGAEGRTKAVGSMMSNTKGVKKLSGIRADSTSYFLVYGPELRSFASAVNLVRMSYKDRVVLGTGIFGDQKTAYLAQMWVLESTVKVRVGPVPGNPDLQRVVPSEPLKDGAYGLMAGEFNSGVPFGESGVFLDFQVGEVSVESVPANDGVSVSPKPGASRPAVKAPTFPLEACEKRFTKGKGGIFAVYHEAWTAFRAPDIGTAFDRMKSSVEVAGWSRTEDDKLRTVLVATNPTIGSSKGKVTLTLDRTDQEGVFRVTAGFRFGDGSFGKPAIVQAELCRLMDAIADSAEAVGGTATSLREPVPLTWGGVRPIPLEARDVSSTGPAGSWSTGSGGELRFGGKAFQPEVTLTSGQPAEWKIVRDGSGRWAVAFGGRGANTTAWGVDLETGRAIALQQSGMPKGPAGHIAWKPEAHSCAFWFGGPGGVLVLFDADAMRVRASAPLPRKAGVRHVIQDLWWAGDGLQVSVLDECEVSRGTWRTCRGANQYLLAASPEDLKIEAAGSVADRRSRWEQFFSTQQELLAAAPTEPKDGKADQLTLGITGKAKAYRNLYALSLLLREEAKDDLAAARSRCAAGDLAGTAFFSGRSVRNLAESNDAAKQANLAWGDSLTLAAEWARFTHDAAALSAEVVLTTFAFNPAARKGFSALFTTTAFVADQEMYGCEVAVRNLVARLAQDVVSRKLGLTAEVGGIGWEPGPVLGKGVVSAAYAAQKKEAAEALAGSEELIYNEMKAHLGAGGGCFSREGIAKVVGKVRELLAAGAPDPRAP